MSQPTKPDPFLAFVGGAMLAVGWLVLTLGGLCTLAIGFFTVVGVGDHEGHASLEDWVVPAGMLAFGAGCIWAGRQVRRTARTDGGDDRPQA